MRIRHAAWPAVLLAAWVFAAAAAQAPDDTRLQSATEQVLDNPRYLHHSRLEPGMMGYGLTVLKGTTITRFEVEITSVMAGMAPQKDMILARARGADLERTGVLAGMSGSPVYVSHEGRDKLIGAVAYAFPFQKDEPAGPVVGIQPIAQMLAVAEASPAGSQAATEPAVMGRLPRKWLETALDGRKLDFVALSRPGRNDPAPAGLRPLAMPLMAGGLSDRSRSYLERALAGGNLLCVGVGGGGGTPAEKADDVALEPGAAFSVPLVTGDEDIMALGTVTDVFDGGRILALGHAMTAAGGVSYPLATARVHDIVPRITYGFKLGGTLKQVGAITGDELTAVAGRLGEEVPMIPLAIEVGWAHPPQHQSFRYRVIRDRDLTGLMAMVVCMDTLWGTRRLPSDHTVEYSVLVDFGELGSYRTENLTSQMDVAAVLSDLGRPIFLMANNPFGTVHPVRAEASVRIREGARRADILGVRLDRNVYAPGETLEATATLHMIKGPRITRTIRLKLPEDISEGDHKLRVGSWETALAARKRQEPRAFDPRNLSELLAALQRVAEPRMDRLYAVLELPGERVAVDTLALTEAPPTVAEALKAARPLDFSAGMRAVTAELPMELAVTGSAEATVTVSKKPPRP